MCQFPVNAIGDGGLIDARRPRRGRLRVEPRNRSTRGEVVLLNGLGRTGMRTVVYELSAGC